MRSMKACLGAVLALIPIIPIVQAQDTSIENPVSFHLNYAEGEKNTYDYTENGCRIIGKLYSPDTTKPKKKKKHPMANMPVLKEHRVKKGKHTTVFKKVKPPKKKRKKQEAVAVTQDASFDLTQAIPAGADVTKPTKSFALQAKVYSDDLTILSWRTEEGEQMTAAVPESLLPLSSFTAFESATTTYLFFYLPEDLREDASAQRNKPEVPAFPKGKGLQAVLLEGDANNAEATDGLSALLDIYDTHKKDLKKVYKAYEKRKKELAKQPKVKTPEPSETTLYFWEEN